MHDSATQMDTSPAFSMLPDLAFGGAGAGCSCGIGQKITNDWNWTPVPQFSAGTQFPASAWGSLDPKSSVAASSTGLYSARGNSFDASWSQFHGDSNRIRDHSHAPPYTRQPLSLGDYVNDSQLQGCNNHGYGQSQAGYNNSVIDFDNDYQNQPNFIENQALTTRLNHQAHFLGGQTNPFGVNVYENPCVESPALYRPNFTNAVYPNQTYSDATFADFNAADPSPCDLTASSLNLSGSAYSGHTLQLPVYPEDSLLTNPTFPVQTSFSDEYLPNAYQNMHLPAQDLQNNLTSHSSALPITSASHMQHALPPTHQQPSFPCTQPNCLATFKREADRIRHENTRHGSNNVLHLCPIPGCVKAQGSGYSRADKVTEHLWKKHGDLGYVKRV